MKPWKDQLLACVLYLPLTSDQEKRNFLFIYFCQWFGDFECLWGTEIRVGVQSRKWKWKQCEEVGFNDRPRRQIFLWAVDISVSLHLQIVIFHKESLWKGVDLIISVFLLGERERTLSCICVWLYLWKAWQVSAEGSKPVEKNSLCYLKMQRKRSYSLNGWILNSSKTLTGCKG